LPDQGGLILLHQVRNKPGSNQMKKEVVMKTFTENLKWALWLLYPLAVVIIVIFSVIR
jgi:hypothetical protein